MCDQVVVFPQWLALVIAAAIGLAFVASGCLYYRRRRGRDE